MTKYFFIFCLSYEREGNSCQRADGDEAAQRQFLKIKEHKKLALCAQGEYAERRK
jgi:hypothetical protein